MTPKFKNYLTESEEIPFKASDYAVDPTAIQQSVSKNPYIPQPQQTGVFRYLLEKGIEFKVMSSFMKKSLGPSFGNLVQAGARAGVQEVGLSAGANAVRVGILARIGAVVGPKLGALAVNPYFWIGVGVVAAGTLGYMYLSGNPTMFEIDEGWKDGKHKENDKTKDVYKIAGSTLHHSAYVGTSTVLDIMTKENLYFRINVKDQNVASRFDSGVYNLIQQSGTTKRLFNQPDVNYWINTLKTQVSGMPVSGKQNVKDYSLMKQYVAKYDLESSGGNNPYKTEVAEESEGWFDTFFEQFVPGMNSLGWASFMLSSEYLNQVNALKYLDNKPFLYKIIQSWWTLKVKDLNANSFSVQNMVDFMTWITNGKSYLTSQDFDNVLICVKGGKINEEPDTKYTVSEFLAKVGKEITDKIKQSVEGGEKLAHTNVTVAFSMFCSCFSIIDMITNTFATQVTEYEVYKKQLEEDQKKKEQDIKEADPTYQSKYSQEVIKNLMANVDFSKYEG